MLARFFTRVTIEQFDGLKWSHLMDARIKAIIREGAVRFMRVIAVRIPVYTGFLRGSFMNLEYAIGSGTGKINVRQVGKKGKNPAAPNFQKQRSKLTTTFRKPPGARKADALNRLRRIGRRLNKLKDKQISGSRIEQGRQELRGEFAASKARQKELLRLRGQAKTKTEKQKITQQIFKERMRVEKLANRLERGVKQQARIQKQIARLTKRSNKLAQQLVRLSGIKGRKVKKMSEKELLEAVRKTYKKQLMNSKNPQYYYDKIRNSSNKTGFKTAWEKDPWYYPFTGNNSRIPKRPERGRAFGTPLSKIFTHENPRTVTIGFGAGAKTAAGMAATGISPTIQNNMKPWYGFRYDSLVRYLPINDRKEGWNSWNAATLAFNLYVQGQLATLLGKGLDEFVFSRTTTHGHERTEQEVRANFAQHGSFTSRTRVNINGKQFKIRNQPDINRQF